MDKVEVIVRASSLHGKREIARLKENILSGIRTAGGFAVSEVDFPSGEGFPAILVLTGGVEREVLKVVSQLPPPAILIAHPGHNSLPASLEILARIRQDGGEGRILFGSPEEIAAGLSRELRVASAWEELRFSRVGLIGEPSEWLVASDVDRAFLKGRMGIEIVKIPIDELISRVRKAWASRRDLSRFTKEAAEVAEPSAEELRGAVAIYRAIRELVDEYRLAAFTIRCFDLVTQVQNTGCYALSRLNDERVPAGCEGDMQALFSLYLGSLLIDRPAFMANVTAVDVGAGKIHLAHCTCPLSLASGYAVRSHFESGIGVGIAAKIPPGPCTVFRLGGERLDHLFVREGMIEETPPREDLCRTQLGIAIEGPIDTLLTEPLGNHHILLPGRHRKTVEHFFTRFLTP